MGCNLSLLHLGHICGHQEEKLKYRNRKLHLQTRSASFHFEPLSFPTNISFHGSEEAPRPRLAGESTSTAVVLDFHVQQNSDLSRDAELVGLRRSPGIAINCGNLRRPWQEAFGPHLASPSSLLPGEHRCITQASCSGLVLALPTGLKWAT